MVNIATFMLEIALKRVITCLIQQSHQRFRLIQMMVMNKERSNQNHKVKNQRSRQLKEKKAKQKRKKTNDLPKFYE